MDSGIPLSRGLGSSAAAVVAVGVLQLVPSSFVPFRGRETCLGSTRLTSFVSRLNCSPEEVILTWTNFLGRNARQRDRPTKSI